MTSSPGSPEPASPPPTDEARDEYLRSVAQKNVAQTASIRLRNLVIGILGTALVLLAAGFLWLGLQFKSSGDQAAARASSVLAIAKGFQCQITPTTKGCPPPSAAQRQAQSGQSAAVDSIVYRVESFVASELGKPPPPKPADVP